MAEGQDDPAVAAARGEHVCLGEDGLIGGQHAGKEGADGFPPEVRRDDASRCQPRADRLEKGARRERVGDVVDAVGVEDDDVPALLAALDEGPSVADVDVGRGVTAKAHVALGALDHDRVELDDVEAGHREVTSDEGREGPAAEADEEHPRGLRAKREGVRELADVRELDVVWIPETHRALVDAMPLEAQAPKAMGVLDHVDPMIRALALGDHVLSLRCAAGEERPERDEGQEPLDQACHGSHRSQPLRRAPPRHRAFSRIPSSTRTRLQPTRARRPLLASLWVATVAVLALAFAAPRLVRADDPAGVVVPPRPITLGEAVVPSGTQPIDADVVLILTIDLDGSVSEAVIERGAGDPWDRLAVETARTFRFEPATLDGKPIPVRVPFTYAFRKPARRGRSPEARRDRAAMEPAPGYVFSGVLLEKGTRAPQAGVPVLVRDPRTDRTWEVLTDADGNFTAFGLPKGRLRLDIFTGGFEPLERDIVVRTTSEDEASKAAEPYYLAPGGLSAYRTVVREERAPKAATVIELTDDELTRVAGTLGDPTRVVASLPGVARTPFGLGYFVVRGAQLDNTGFFIDGHPAVFLYHLLGGPGVIHPQLVGRLSFYPGGYPAQYGRVASAAIAVETKDPPADRWHLDLEMDLFKAGVLFSVPFDDGDGIVSVALRRSYFELILPLINDDINVNYTDYQLRVSYKLSDRVKARFVALGAVDGVETVGVSTGDGAGTSTTRLGLGFHRLNLAFDIQLAKDVTLLESAAFEYDFIDNRRVAEGDSPIDANTTAWFAQLLSIARWKPSPDYQLDAGLDLFYLKANADLSIPAAPPLGDPRAPVFDPVIVNADLNAPYLSVAPFVSAELGLAPGLKLLPGVRLNIDDYGGGWNVTVDPKLAVRFQVAEDWTLKAMAAVANQPPQVFQVAAPFGDPSIPTVRGTQASMGFEWTPTDDWFISVEGFYQHLDRIVRPSNRLASDDGDFGRVYWDPDVQGRAFGAEVLIRKEFGGWVYGWLSYTLSRAERNRPPDGWGLFELDQTHVLNLAWTFRLGNEWSLSTRFQLASGNPYYPILGGVYDADEDDFTPVYSARQSRLEPFHRLDLRLDKTFRYETWMLEVFLDIQNVYNAQNQEAPRYSYDFRIRTTGISLPILPSIGFRMVF